MSKTTNDYNSIAWAYDFLSKSIFSNNLEKAQTAFLKDFKDNSSILIIGGGSGYLLQQILTHTKETNVVYVDASSKMINRAKYRLRNLASATQQRVEFICGTEDEIPATHLFDNICTHFFLDLFKEEELTLLMNKLTSHSKPNTQWFFADFQNTNSIIQTILMKVIFLFFKITTNVSSSSLPNYNKSFERFGWKEIKTRYFYYRMIKSSLLMKVNKVYSIR